MEKINIGIFDDHTFTAKGVAYYLTNNTIHISFCCQTKTELIASIEASEIELIILDVIAPDVLGLELFETIANNYPAIHIIAHTTLSSAMLVENLLSIGVKGFVNKKQPEADLLACIQAVCAGEIHIPEEYHFLTSKYRTLSSNILSPREVQILQLISAELTSQAIADRLTLSLFTVENHRKSIFKKLAVKNLAGMLMTASRLGYIS
jgi:DNA-binding NarL/FixJ family response regulator